MKKTIYILITVIILAALVLFLKRNKDVAQSKVYHYDKELPVNVEVDTLKLQAVDEQQYFSGSFEPEKEVKLGAETPGKIKGIFVDNGSNVRKGQGLIKIDDELLR